MLLRNFCFLIFISVLSDIRGTNFETKWAFEENQGQVTGEDADRVKFFFRSKNTGIFLLNTGIAYQFQKNNFSSIDSIKLNPNSISSETYRMDIELLGANPHSKITKESRSSDYIQYYTFSIFGIHAYKKIIYHDIYPHIDWVVYEHENGIKYDFIVHPGGNPKDIKLKTKWVEDISLDNSGNLILKNRLGTITENKPISYQNNQEIETKFVLNSDIIQFQVSEYNPSQTLRIDPTLIWATYYGGTNTDQGLSTCTDASGNVYMSGFSYSTTNIASGGYQTTQAGSIDAFLVKFNTNGTRLWATYYGGANSDISNSCITDASKNIYICGETYSTSSISSGGHQNSFGGQQDAFLVKFDSAGTRLWATYYGGTQGDNGFSTATDASGNVYLAGTTTSSNAISSGGYQNGIAGSNDAFLVKFNSSGTRIWATYYGGGDVDYGKCCHTDPSGNVFVSGYTFSNSGIASGGHQNSIGGSSDGFLVKFNSSGARQWATYYGGSNYDYGNGSSNDASGNVYLCGQVSSTNNIFSGGHQSSYGGSDDAFLVKFNSSGTRQWGTYYGGNAGDYANACYNDASGNVYLVGNTSSSASISSNGIQNSINGSNDGFLAKFNSAGTRQWGTYYGGSASDESKSCYIDLYEDIYMCGYTFSSAGISSGGHQNSYGGSTDAFLTKISNISNPTITIYKNKSDTICSGTKVIFTSNIFYGGTTPKYKWYKNGVLVDTTATYTTSNIANGDSVICLLKSSVANLSTDSAWSNVFRFKVKPISTKSITDTTCSNSNYIFGGNAITTSGTYIDTLVNYVGCDSIVTLTIYVKQASYNSIYDTICANQVRWFNNTALNSTGIYKDTFVNSVSCDSIVSLYLYVKNTSSKQIYDTICSNQSYIFNGTYISISGIYKDTLVNSVGCDSFLTLNFHVKSISFKTLNISICNGQSYFFNGQNRTTSGTFLDTLVNSVGCDSFLTLNLTVNNTSSNSINVITCSNNPYFFNGMNRTTTGTYLDTLVNSKGCDSFLTLNLTVNNINFSNIDTTICANHPYFFNGSNRNTTGTYKDTLLNSLNCDSVITLNLTVKPISNLTRNDSICQGDSILFKSVWRKIAGTYIDTLVNSLGCDSFVTMNLTVKPLIIKNMNVAICLGDSFYFKGAYRYITGVYRDTIRSTTGTCDTAAKLTLTVNLPSFKNLVITRCKNNPYFFGGKYLDSSGFYYDTLTNSKGCDSFVSLILTMKQISFYTFQKTICQNQPYLFNGQYLNVTGDYYDTLVNSRGCDSIITLKLTVNPAPTTIIDTYVCNNTSLLFNNQVITSAGMYYDTFQTTKGCDSFIELRVTKRATSSFTLYHKFCSNNPRYFNGKYIDSAGVYLDTLFNSQGCDSFLTLVLFRDLANDITILDSICIGDSLYFNQAYRTTAGIYKDTLSNQGGCDSFVTLKLSYFPVQSLAITAAKSNFLVSTMNFKSYQWYLNSSILANENKYYHQAKSNGNYTVQASDFNNCRYISSNFSYTLNSIQSISTENFSIYPNPAKESITISSEYLMQGNTEVNIYSIDGKRILSHEIKERVDKYTLPIQVLSQGNYIIEIRNEQHNSKVKFSKE